MAGIRMEGRFTPVLRPAICNSLVDWEDLSHVATVHTQYESLKSMVRKLLNFFLSPQKLVFKAWALTGAGSFRLRLDYDIFPRPHYAYCLYHAARQAQALGLTRISVMEFGVAGGNGLLALEALAAQIEKEIPVEVEIWGFDTGEGLPEPVDYRDLPYIWQQGFFKMDEAALRARLGRSQLVLGDVKDTVPAFFDAHDAAPLGAAFLDLDFWSSTCNALRIFEAPDTSRLPRVFCYFDDVGSAEDGGLMNDYVGQLASIRDYNTEHETKKITQIAGMHHLRRIPAGWNEKIYVHHDFAHTRHDEYIHADKNRQLVI
ncbi:MAG: hypothetical protein AAFP68_05170 [Pseudomonadota bacterium]